MELWGGIECTINRVEDLYIDQLEYSGHYGRLQDITLFSDLGIKKIRYPVLWEKHQPDARRPIDWTHTEKKLHGLRRCGIECIAGLVHHGSGPRYVNMLDDSFASGLAAYSRQVAEKFPWINYYTPVNEPLTTARFCGLYGLWYPHGTNDRSFVRILLNECRATVLAMQEIRRINPDAKLVQTEDLGKIHSTPVLKYQAVFENYRRWLSLDLLCGKVLPDHPLYTYLLENGAGADELIFFTEHPCQPDIMGFNYYVTSERYLDQKLNQYPPHTHGGNGRHRYADVEAIRVGNAEVSGPVKLLKEAWERYGLPLAITEVHMHCTREEQLRWLQTVWDAADQLVQENIDILGITAWALLGSYGWNKLLSQPHGDYEPGVFTLQSGYPRPTALSRMLRCLSQGERYKHPVMANPGWWSRDIRIIYNRPEAAKEEESLTACQPLLITGPSDVVNQAFARACRHRNISYRLFSNPGTDTDNWLPEQVIRLKPWGIIYTHGLLDALSCEASNRGDAGKDESGSLARLSSLYTIKLLAFSGALVFDAVGQPPSCFENSYLDQIAVLQERRISAVQSILRKAPSALIADAGFLYNHPDQKELITGLLERFSDLQPNDFEDELFNEVVYIPDMVQACLDLMIDDETGVCHMEQRPGKEVSWRKADQSIS